jgi:hypothetical protein
MDARHWIVRCLDKPGMLDMRLKHVEEHRAYLATEPIRIAVSGPLVADDGETMIGSFFVVEAETRAEVEAFQAGDPLFKAGVWESREIHRFFKRVG